MVAVIQQIILAFNATYNQNASFDLKERKNVGLFYAMGQVYTLVWLAEPRIDDLERLIRLHGKTNIVLFCKVIYSTGRALLEQEGISYLEWQGRTFLADAPAAANELNKNKENRYDQRLNESRINCKTGSAILLALAKSPEILQLTVREQANYFKIADQTMYYYLSQFKKSGYIVKNEYKNWVVNMKMIDEDKLMGSLEARGCNQLKAEYKIKCDFTQLKRCKKLAEKDEVCKFLDELGHCEDMVARIDMEVAKGVFVFISPYNRELFPEFEKKFRVDFKAWYTKRQIQRWA